jgi:hypothetical protein
VLIPETHGGSVRAGALFEPKMTLDRMVLSGGGIPQHFMEHEGSLTFSLESSTGP